MCTGLLFKEAFVVSRMFSLRKGCALKKRAALKKAFFFKGIGPTLQKEV